MLTDLQRIGHMIENAELLLQFAANLSEEEYASSVEKQSAVKFAFVMLGEDAAAVSEELKLKYPVIPWQKIRSMRNTVAHDYLKTEEKVIWETVQRDIGLLRQQLLQVKSEMQS